MGLVKIPKTVTIYGPGGRVYKNEAPAELVDAGVKAAIDRAKKQARANIDRHAKYAGHADSDKLVEQFKAELADLEGSSPPGPPPEPPQGEKKGKTGKGKADK